MGGTRHSGAKFRSFGASGQRVKGESNLPGIYQAYPKLPARVIWSVRKLSRCPNRENPPPQFHVMSSEHDPIQISKSRCERQFAARMVARLGRSVQGIQRRGVQ